MSKLVQRDALFEFCISGKRPTVNVILDPPSFLISTQCMLGMAELSESSSISKPFLSALVFRCCHHREAALEVSNTTYLSQITKLL